MMRVTYYCKRWWNEEVAKARKIWAKGKKIQGQITPNRDKLKQARNARGCWQDFLEDKEETLDPAEIRPGDKNRCWTALFAAVLAMTAYGNVDRDLRNVLYVQDPMSQKSTNVE